MLGVLLLLWILLLLLLLFPGYERPGNSVEFSREWREGWTALR